eukprot:SAG25_NODE_145_length_13941_cov_48.705967_4_plen_93_part_00
MRESPPPPCQHDPSSSSSSSSSILSYLAAAVHHGAMMWCVHALAGDGVNFIASGGQAQSHFTQFASEETALKPCVKSCCCCCCLPLCTAPLH